MKKEKDISNTDLIYYYIDNIKMKRQYFLFPELDDDGNIILFDNTGFLVPIKQIEMLKKIIQRYENNYTAKEIDLINKNMQSNFEKEMFENSGINKTPRVKKNGFLYLLQSDHGYKIGITKHIQQRVDSYKSLPFSVELIYSCECIGYFAVEKHLLKKYSTKRIKGEWFRLIENDIEYIKKYCEGHNVSLLEQGANHE